MDASSYRFTAVFSTAAVVVLFALCQSPQPTAGAHWETPCDGEGEGENTTEGSAPASNAEDFATLSNRVTSLKNEVDSLKTSYVAARFNNDASSAEASLDFNTPDANAPYWNHTNANGNETLEICYGNLARLTVLSNRPIIYQGEKDSITVPNFEARFLELSHHSYRGLYVIMCELSTVVKNLAVTLFSAETKAAIEAISLPTPPSEAARHVQEHYVIRHFEISAEKLIAVFNSFAGQTA